MNFIIELIINYDILILFKIFIEWVVIQRQQ